jgi:hypothetical protein
MNYLLLTMRCIVERLVVDYFVELLALFGFAFTLCDRALAGCFACWLLYMVFWNLILHLDISRIIQPIVSLRKVT